MAPVIGLQPLLPWLLSHLAMALASVRLSPQLINWTAAAVLLWLGSVGASMVLAVMVRRRDGRRRGAAHG